LESNGKPLILMADDDDDDCSLAKDAFQLSGSHGTIYCVEDGIELMEYLSRSTILPALILLDLNMPRKDGRQALKEVKAIPAYQSIPVVVFTTSQEDSDSIYCMAEGAASFITKPTSFTKWVEIMKSLSNTWLPDE
jgi:CheY-like chemotaxis protein